MQNVENQLRATSPQSPPVEKRVGDNDLLGREREQKLKGLDKIKSTILFLLRTGR
jgi:hypothetical protein